MNKIDQILNYIKQINERLNLWVANAKKIEELPEMGTVNPESLMMVSELEEGIWTSKKLEIQTIIDGISLAGQNNTVREVLLGEITDEHDLEYLFDNNSISVGPTELVVLIVLQTISAKQIQRQFLWKLGKGDFAPIGSSDLNTKVLELQPKFINEIIADELTAAPDAIVYDFGTITDPIIDVINVSTPVFDFSNDEKIYYIRFTKDDIKYLYNFVGVDGEYGDSALQMVESDLVLVYSSEIIDVVSLIEGKLDKDGYPGTAQDLNLRIGVLEGAQGKGNRFTGKSYVLWSGTGLTYDVIYTSYYLADVLYPGGVTQITLAASDPTNPRFDLVKVDATGVVVATGTPSASPEVPTADPNTELAISPIFVEAGATTPPATVSNENVYQENAEWTPSTNNGTVNFNATSSPFQGSKHIDCGAFTNGQYLKFIDGAINQIADLSEIGIAINLKATFSNSTKFTVRFYNGTTSVSSIVTINSGSYNFDRTIVNAYQLVIIPISAFTFASSSFDRIDIVMAGANAVGFRMDNIILYKGSGSASPEQKAITTIITDSGVVNATQKDDTIQLIGGLGIDITSSGKVITISGTTDLSNYYTKAQTDSADAATLASAQSYAANLITQIINGAPADADTLKELNDKIVALQAIVGGTTPDGDSVVNTVTELLAVFSTFPEGVDVATLINGKVDKTDIYNALDCVVSGKVADARTVKTLNDLITALTATVAGKQDNLTDANVGAFEAAVPTVSTIADTDKVPLLVGSLRRMITWTNFKALFKTVGGNSIFGSGDISVGSGDMTTNTDQNVSGIKTFLAGKFGLRNTANTFTSFFASAVTASRTWTFPDKSGTVAMTSDLPTNTIATGTQNFIPKYNNAGGTQIGISRLKDDGSKLGIGSISPIALTKDVQLGRDANKEFGVEQSDSNNAGKDFTVSAGRTINYQETSVFTPIPGSNIDVWECIGVNSATGDVYAGAYQNIYKQTGGVGSFSLIGSIAARYWNAIAVNSVTNDVYIADWNNGGIFKQTGGIGSFTVISGTTGLAWGSLAIDDSTGNVYAGIGSCVRAGGGSSGDVYKQTGGTGSFVAMGQTIRDYTGLGFYNGDLYAACYGNGLYKMTGATGSFTSISSSAFNWQCIAANSDGVFAGTGRNGSGGDIYKQTGGTGSFVAMGGPIVSWSGIIFKSNGVGYASASNNGTGIDYMYNLPTSLGSPNLNGGTLKLKAGTGKGTGQSRVQIVTGQKTVSGTDMQVETVRAEFDESGNYKRIGTPVYADNTAALAGGLLAGMEYRTSTGVKMEVY